MSGRIDIDLFVYIRLILGAKFDDDRKTTISRDSLAFTSLATLSCFYSLTEP